MMNMEVAPVVGVCARGVSGPGRMENPFELALPEQDVREPEGGQGRIMGSRTLLDSWVHESSFGLARARDVLCPQGWRHLVCFHGYLMKYTNMVIRGQLPQVGTRAGNDAAKTLKNLLKKGAPADQAALSKVCRTLHLAFKSLTTDEVYDVMVLCFLRACHRYDPCYQDKVKQVSEVLNGKTWRERFTPGELRALVGFDVTRHRRPGHRSRHSLSPGGRVWS
jgi:hypothetical protein